MPDERPSLGEDSRAYRSDAAAYDLFSRCEDAPGLVAAAIARNLPGGRALDLGCGSGKYTGLIGARSLSVTGLDRSEEQLATAARGAPGANATFVRGDATDLPFATGSFDVVLACWVIGTVVEGERRERALSEAIRVLAPGGRILLVENAGGCAFEAVRGRVDDPGDRTGRYNRWLASRGFRTVADIPTRFGFPELAAARATFSTIWGDEVGSRLTSAGLEHRVVLLRLDA